MFERYKFNTKKRYTFFVEIEALMKSGMTLMDSCKRISTMYKKQDPIAMFANDLLEGANKGDIQSPIKKWLRGAEMMIFSQIIYLSDPINSIQNIISIVNINIKIKQAVSKTLIPLLMVFSLPLILYFFSVFLEDFSKVSQVNVSAITITNYFKNNLFQIYIGLFAFCGIIAYILPNWGGNVRLLFNRLPIFNIYIMIQSIAFFSTLSGLVNSGLLLPIALKNIYKNSNPATRGTYKKIIYGLNSGKTIGDVLKENRFPDTSIAQRIQVISEVGNFSNFLDALSNEITNDILKNIENNTLIFQVIILILFASIFIFLIASINIKYILLG